MKDFMKHGTIENLYANILLIALCLFLLILDLLFSEQPNVFFISLWSFYLGLFLYWYIKTLSILRRGE